MPQQFDLAAGVFRSHLIRRAVTRSDKLISTCARAGTSRQLVAVAEFAWMSTGTFCTGAVVLDGSWTSHDSLHEPPYATRAHQV